MPEGSIEGQHFMRPTLLSPAWSAPAGCPGPRRRTWRASAPRSGAAGRSGTLYPVFEKQTRQHDVVKSQRQCLPRCYHEVQLKAV